MKKEECSLEPIYKLLATVLEVDLQQILDFPLSEPLEILGMDSMNMIRFILLLEEHYDNVFLNSDLILSNFSTLKRLFLTLKKYQIGGKT